MEGKIHISGLIGTLPNEKGVELIDIIQQVKSQPGATSYTVYINSEGGVVDTGFEIYDYLKSLNLPVKTIGSTMVASIATIIFMAGHERVLQPNTQFMIHSPMGGIENGTATEIQSYGELLKKTEDRIVDFYKKATDTTAEAIRPLLAKETWLTPEQCLAFGFTTQNTLPMVACAYINLNNRDMTEKDRSWFEKTLDKLINKASGKQIVNMTVTDADGVIIEFPDLADGDTPKVGDRAIVAGEPANGTHLVGDINHVFENGELVEIVENVEVDNTEELAALRTENAELKEQLATSQNKLDTLVSDFTSFKKQVTSRFDVDKKGEPAKKQDVVHGEQVNRLSGTADKLKQLKK